jgi:hypothetical protein
MDGRRNQRSEPRTKPFVSPLPEIGATCPRCPRTDFGFDHRSQDTGHRAQIRACANVEKVRRHQQAAGDTPPHRPRFQTSERTRLRTTSPWRGPRDAMRCASFIGLTNGTGLLVFPVVIVRGPSAHGAINRVQRSARFATARRAKADSILHGFGLPATHLAAIVVQFMAWHPARMAPLDPILDPRPDSAEPEALVRASMLLPNPPAIRWGSAVAFPYSDKMRSVNATDDKPLSREKSGACISQRSEKCCSASPRITTTSPKIPRRLSSSSAIRSCYSAVGPQALGFLFRQDLGFLENRCGTISPRWGGGAAWCSSTRVVS